MLTDDQIDQLRKQADPKRVLDDAEFDRINALEDDAFARLPADTVHKFFCTSKWHRDRRMSFDSLEGMEIDGRSIDDVLNDSDDHGS